MGRCSYAIIASMTSRERLDRVIHGKLPDCVPVAPDTSNMIPVRLTGKPFWDIYLYQDPPLWKAYLDCVKRFGFDSLMDGYAPIRFEELGEIDWGAEEFIVQQLEDRIVTQVRHRGTEWDTTVTVYPIDNPPARRILPHKLGLPSTPIEHTPVAGRLEWPEGEELLALVMKEMGDFGLVGVNCGTTKLIHSEQEIFDYFDDPSKYDSLRDRLLESYERRFDKLMSLDNRPDFISAGGSGTLIHQTPETFRRLGLPILKKITALGKKYGIPTHVHSCGPERELVRMAAEQTDLTIIDPLEEPPMGDCDLGEIKRSFGDDLILKGNLHTTKIMLRGSVSDVIEASRMAIDSAGEGGRFILSTGDQCGRDTPDENILAMIDTARSYGKY